MWGLEASGSGPDVVRAHSNGVETALSGMIPGYPGTAPGRPDSTTKLRRGETVA
jgi:hypothetical protein